MFKTSLLLVVIPCMISSTVIGDLAATMSAGSWKSLPLRGNAVFNTGENNENIFDWSQNGGWDSASNHFFFINAPAHNPTSFIIYNANVDSFRSGPLWTTNYASHTYDAQTIYDPTGEYYYRPALFKKFLKYKTGMQTWEVVAENSTYSAAYAYGTAITQFPEMGGIVHIFAGTVSLFNISTGKWSQIASGLSMGSPHNLAEYNPIHKLVVFGFGNNSVDMYKMDTNGTITKLRNPPSIVKTNINGVKMFCDPVSGDYLFMNEDSLRAYDVITDTWRTIRKNPFTGVSRMAMIAIPEYEVTAIISVYAPAFVLYKHASAISTEVSNIRMSSTFTLDCFPNPSSGDFQVLLNGYSRENRGILTLYNMLGQNTENLNHLINGSTLKVPAKNRAPGTYILQWQTQDKTTRKPIIITR